jgi:hypothetical protein
MVRLCLISEKLGVWKYLFRCALYEMDGFVAAGWIN